MANYFESSHGANHTDQQSVVLLMAGKKAPEKIMEQEFVKNIK